MEAAQTLSTMGFLAQKEATRMEHFHETPIYQAGIEGGWISWWEEDKTMWRCQLYQKSWPAKRTVAFTLLFWHWID